MNDYIELKNLQQERVNDFPMSFAFSNEQFEEGMKKLGLEIKDTDKVLSIPGGGFIRKTDREKFREMLSTNRKEMDDAIAADETGSGFILNMFRYELDNHECNYTGDPEPALDALGLSLEDIEKNEALSKGFKLAFGGY